MNRSKPALKPQLEISTRETERHAFLKHHAKALIALPADASKRQYFRYDGGLLMDAPHPENPSQFFRIANYLKSLGLSAPSILDHDLSQGFLALEDFGDATYTRLLQAGENPYPLYELAVDALIVLHQEALNCPDFIEPYTMELLLREMEIFTDWYLIHTKGIELSNFEKQAYCDLWATVFEKALDIPHSLVLRDYHVDNLMRLEDRPGVQACGLLDFQDARWGPIVYDLVSLVEDERLDLEPALVKHCWQRYLCAFPHINEEILRTSGCILAAGRHTKNIGIFTRLAVRDGKPHYLNHLPRMWRLLENCLNHPNLHELKAWFDNYVGTSKPDAPVIS
jgi:aminoglycoside/choline kinase family phosphotransferase